jgi:hypothetical protein
MGSECNKFPWSSRKNLFFLIFDDPRRARSYRYVVKGDAASLRREPRIILTENTSTCTAMRVSHSEFFLQRPGSGIHCASLEIDVAVIDDGPLATMH